MQHTERLLQLLIASLAVLGTFMLGADGQMPYMIPLVIGAAIGGLVLTDWLAWVHMHRLVVNLAAIAALVITLSDFLQSSSSRQLMSIAYLLVCWEVVMLFQKKSLRVYWCLTVLSLLQVVVASVIHPDLNRSLLLGVYLAVGFIAMLLMHVHSELLRCAASRRRWRRAGRRSRKPATCSELSSEAVAERLSRGALVKHLLAISAAATTFSVVFFYGTPRRDVRGWAGASGVRAQTGFASEVTLKQMGQILQSDQLVMRVTLTEQNSGEPYRVFNEPHFLGAVLDQYRMGHWSVQQGRFRQLPADAGQHRLEGRDLVRQQILLEPSSHRTAFAIWPCHAAPSTPVILRVGRRGQTLERNAAKHNDLHLPLRYTLWTTAFRNGIQQKLRPHLVAADQRRRPGVLTPNERARLLQIRRAQFPQLIAAAERALAAGAPVGQAAPTSHTALEAATLLEQHFLQSDYSYSLNLPPRTPAGVDPIEHFVATVRVGHCEYFASALAIMLRSQGIPARVAVGYRGGDLNRVGNFYQVRQRHAHAWVEAYLEPRDTPADLPRGAGAWLTLDPTPSSDINAPGRGRIDDVLDYAQLLWSDYMLGLDPDAEGHPVQAAFAEEGALARLTRRSALWNNLRERSRKTYAAVAEWLGGAWFSWRAGLLAMAVVASCLAAIRLSRWLTGGLIRSLDRWQRRKTSPMVVIPFYRRLESALKHCGFVQPSHATQAEFASQVERQLRQAAEQTAGTTAGKSAGKSVELSSEGSGAGDLLAVAHVPRDVAAAFYRVRFGGAALDSGESHQIEQSLTRLEAALDAHRDLLIRAFRTRKS